MSPQGNGHNTVVYSWSTTDFRTWNFSTVFQYPSGTYNVQVTRVGPLPGSGGRIAVPHSSALPPHRFAMIIECFDVAINNNADGNLTYGWQFIPSTAPSAPCGGPAMYFNPYDGLYYLFTGGNTVSLVRTADFQTWNTSTIDPFIEPSVGDGYVAPFANFPAWAKIKGSPPNRYVGVPEPYPHQPFVPVWQSAVSSWSVNSNDADMCCMHANITTTWFSWGASTQGWPPQPPLTGSDASTNVVATNDTQGLWVTLNSVF